MAEYKRRCPRCPGIWGSGCPTPHPCFPPAAVGWGEQWMTMCSLVLALQQWVSLWKRKRGATIIIWPGEGPSRKNPPPLPARDVPTLPTSAAARAPPECPSCLVGAGLGERHKWLWGRESLKAARSNPEITTQHQGTPNFSLETSRKRSAGGEAQGTGLSCSARI